MRKDVRDTALYREAEAFHRSVRRPGSGLISDAAEVSPHGSRVVFAGTIVDSMSGEPPTRICSVDMLTGDTRVLTFGPGVDRLPRFSPDGARIAFLSDRHRAGDFQLHLLDPSSGEVSVTPHVDGWVEYLHWSPDGQRILLGVAGHGADVSGGQGAVASKRVPEDSPSWMPEVGTGKESHAWRRLWIYEIAGNRVRQLPIEGLNVWEAAWCGNEALAIVASPGASEGLWYSARLWIADVQTGASRELFAPNDQIGWPAASPEGERIAIVEALCSDRWIVAGDLRVIERSTGKVRHVDTRGVDVTCTEWRSSHELLLAGHRGFESVVATYDVNANVFTEVWTSRELSAGGFYMTVAGLGDPGDCVLVGGGYLRAPEIAVIRAGEYRAVKSFDLGYNEQARAVGAVEQVTWQAPDGLEIQGWLLRPEDSGPHPLTMYVHGGPVWHWHPMWLGRGNAMALMLVQRGYAVFFPNPRGSSGRGQAFARGVLGDMGGADTYDYLSGLDHLVERGIADRSRLGVVGGSYGGFMASWLITQDSRFAAAVPIAPVSNHVTQHLIGNIPQFVSLFLADSYANPGGKYFQRSPVMHSGKVRTPTLHICGALDRCTPPEEAVQFHNALVEHGTTSVLIVYPEEGHGVRKFPAAFDYAARIIGWFEEHMGAGIKPADDKGCESPTAKQ